MIGDDILSLVDPASTLGSTSPELILGLVVHSLLFDDVASNVPPGPGVAPESSIVIFLLMIKSENIMM